MNNYSTILIYLILIIVIFVFNTKKQPLQCNKCTMNLNNGIYSSKKYGSLTLYYADWCGACKRFMPEWNKLKSLYINNLDFYQIEHKSIPKNILSTLVGFPTIIWNDYATQKQGEISNHYNIINEIGLQRS